MVAQRYGKAQDYAPGYDDDMVEVVSATDCTGLISTPPEDEAEASIYSDLYNIPVDLTRKGPADEN